MWQLSCEGDLFDGKLLWLRPGSQHLLGRTTSKSSGEHVRYIDHKSVSRKHLLIAVDPVKPGDSTRAHARSTITLTDSSKSGTFVNSERLEKSTKIVDKTENKIQLGTSNYVFHVKWIPIVLSFTNLTKVQKSKADSLEEYRALLEHADIKLVTTYLSDSTTHVIATGRNNPSCLQALAQARWTMQYAWVKALIEAVKSDGPELSRLETDFDGSWPAEKDYIVPAGAEPVHQPDAMLHPNDKRSEIFKGLTFVFMVEQQFNTLMPVIVACGGKAIIQEAFALRTTAEQYIEGVKDHLRESKTFKSPDMLGFEKVVVVQPTETKVDIEWWNDFLASVQRQMGKKMVLQVDFLDAILTLDTSGMHESLEDGTMHNARGSFPASSSLPRPSQMQPVVEQSLPPETSNTSPATKSKVKRTRRLITQSRFRGFDDFDPNQVTHPSSPSPEPSPPEAGMSQAEEHSAGASEAHASKKRPLDVNDVMDAHLSGVAAMKKRRIEQEQSSEAVQEKAPTPKPVDPFARKRKDRLIDVKAKLLEQRKREEEERKRNEENLSSRLDGLTVEDMKKFAQHEEFEVIIPEARREAQSDRQASHQWNPAWNGRRNFKGFRPRGSRHEESRQQRVMVGLEPAPVKRAGFLDDAYYLGTPRSNMLSESKNGDQSINTRRSQPEGNSNGRLSTGTNGAQRSQAVVGTQGREKRSLEEQAITSVSKRPRTRIAINLDDDDDELHFRRKRL